MQACHQVPVSRNFSKESEVSSNSDRSTDSQCLSRVSQTFQQCMNRVIQVEEFMHDFRLCNWHKWIDLRKMVHAKLEQELGRPPPCLLMNSYEDGKYLNEEKEVIEQARVHIVPDKWRGSPYDWQTPVLLKNKGNPPLPDCALTRASLERGIIKPPIYVDTPTQMRAEKLIVGPSDRPNAKLNWDKSEYVKAKMNVEGHEVSLIRQHRPKMDNFVIKGIKLENIIEEQNLKKIPVITVTEPGDVGLREQSEESSQTGLLHEEQAFEAGTASINVEGSCFYWNIGEKFSAGKQSCDYQGERKLRISFSTTVNEIATEYVRLENTGSIKLTYWWARREDTCSAPLTSSKLFSKFFFKKMGGIIVPGQIVREPICFRSKFPGIFKERWDLMICPKLTKTDFSISFWFWAIAIKEKMLHVELAKIEAYLNRRVSEAVAQSSVEEVVRRSRYPEPPQIGAKLRFLDETKFKLRNPKYYYHSSVINILKQLYRDVVGDPEAEWNFDIKCLRLMIISDTNDPKKQQERLNLLCKCTKTLLAPCSVPSEETKNYCIVRDILCALANNVEREAESLKTLFQFKIPASSLSPPPSQRSLKTTKGPSKDGISSPRRKSPPQMKGKKRSLESRSKLGLSRQGSRQTPSQKSGSSSKASLKAQDSFVVDDKKYAAYREALFVKVYDHVGTAVEQVAAVLECLKAVE